MSLETPGATRDVEHRVISRFWEFDQSWAWVVKKPYDVAFEDVRSVASFYQVTRNHQWSGTRWEAPIVREADRKRAR